MDRNQNLQGTKDPKRTNRYKDEIYRKIERSSKDRKDISRKIKSANLEDHKKTKKRIRRFFENPHIVKIS